MSIRVKQQLCLNINRVRCLASHPAGRYALRFHILEKNKQYRKYSIPVSVIQSSPSKKTESEITDFSYTTKPFIMKLGGEMLIEELCIFQNDINIFKYQPDFHEITLTLICQLLQVEPNSERVMGTFEGRIKGNTVNQSLVVDFYEAGACQVIGSIHSCIYQFFYSSSNQKIQSFQAYCQTQSKQYVQSLLQYLHQEGKKSYEKISTFLSNFENIKQQNLKDSLISMQKESPIKRQRPRPTQQFIQQFSIVEDYKHKKQEQLQQFGNRVTEADEPVQKFQNVKKKRKRIFLERKSSSGSKNNNLKVTIEEFEKIIHENAINIHLKWRKILSLLFEEQGALILEAYHSEYRQKLNRLMCESVVRFKGSWDLDIYAKEEKIRNKMALQIRDQASINEKQSNQFKFYNATFFNGQNPIIFQESVGQEKKYNCFKQGIEKYFIVLVHGLGACRLDLERVKIELKREYSSDIHIMVSCCNEGRTEGDIDNMGLRLANQIQHELKRVSFKPKICLIGHSMGGIIIRSALPRLEHFSDMFHSFISFSSPHVGYNYSSSKLVDAGLWFINSWSKCQSILQLTMADSNKVEDCFLYKLAQKKGLEWFKKVTFIGSHQDLYVPYYSARIQKHQQCIKDEKNKLEKALVYNTMIDHILNRIRGQLHRIDINFCIPEQNLDNLIGRAAHMNFINSIDMVRLFTLTCQSIII